MSLKAARNRGIPRTRIKKQRENFHKFHDVLHKIDGLK